jgi:hypothetical protein
LLSCQPIHEVRAAYTCHLR